MTGPILTWEATSALAFELADDASLLLFDQVARLIELGASPVNCAKAIRQVHGLGLAACKDLVDSALGEEARQANEQLREALVEEALTWDES